MAELQVEIEGAGAVPAAEALLQISRVSGNWVMKTSTGAEVDMESMRRGAAEYSD